VTERTNEQRRGIGEITPRAARLAWSVCAVSLLVIAFSFVVILLGWATPLPKGWYMWRGYAIETAGYIGAPILGGLIASRRPYNPYGWALLGVGLGFGLISFGYSYAVYALVVEPGSLPAPRMVSMVGDHGFGLTITLLPFLLLLFPDGRLPSQRWKVLAWTVVSVGAVLMLVAGFQPGQSGSAPVANPLGIVGTVGEAIGVLVGGGVLILLCSIILSALSLVLRYRRAVGVERQQIKWFAYATALLGVDLLIGFFVPAFLATILTSVTFLSLYAAIGIAIFRYHLYDIDLLINRTLVYGSLTAMLVALYFGVIVLMQRVFVFITGQDQQPQLAIVASTLVIAALFNPLRRRIQSFIDRSFYRRKYDAAKTLEGSQ